MTKGKWVKPTITERGASMEVTAYYTAKLGPRTSADRGPRKGQ